MQNLKEATKCGKLTERTPTNYPFNLRSDKSTAPDTYKEDYNYCIILMDPQTQKPIDIRIVKTTATLENLIKDKHGRHGLDILFHPNPIKLTADFWERYRKAKNGAERLALFNQFNVLTDKNMLFIDTITIDIDSKFKKSIHALEELIELLDIDREILEIKKTKSKNLRFSFSIEPIRPNEKNKNGNTNLENVKEFVSIINEFFKQRGLKADDSFKRINHPVWITKPEELKQEATKEIDFYTLYRKAKKLNKELQKAKAEESNREEKPKRRLMYLPAFMANRFREIELKTALEKAVETLARTHKQGTYIHFLQPVAGWCKYLGFSYSEFYDLVYPYVRKKEDIKKAWRYARPLEFKNKNPRKAKYDLVEYADRAIEYLTKNGATERQILLKEVFDNQKWLEQIVMQELKEQGVIKEYFEKQEGAGRPKKVYEIIENKGQEKDKQENIDNSYSETHIFANHYKMGISQIDNSLWRESLLEVVGKNIFLTRKVEGVFEFFDRKVYKTPSGRLPFEFSLTPTPIFDFDIRDKEPSRGLAHSTFVAVCSITYFSE
ncbi:MAG TPA: hypothetical protein ENK22_02045 [Persephonella sp.]|nr:hypothetical protein [Persephonella sp.]